MAGARPTSVQVANRALVLYALVRRGYIEHVIANTDGDPLRIRQGESARQETDRWLGREGLLEELSDIERRLFDAPQTPKGWTFQAVNRTPAPAAGGTEGKPRVIRSSDR